jgi:predicted nuclease of predicted toxin-antitoxin system
VRFLLDQDVYAITTRLLRRLGHDVVTASEAGLAQTADSDLLSFAEREARILVTRDRDFGSLVFVRNLGAGVIYLRISPTAVGGVHEELQKVLASHSEDELRKAFVVVEVARHRFRRLQG